MDACLYFMKNIYFLILLYEMDGVVVEIIFKCMAVFSKSTILT